MRHFAHIAICVSLLSACAGKAPEATPGEAEAPAAVPIVAVAETDPSAQDDANDVAVWIHPSDPSRSLVLGTAGTAGLEVFGLDGKLRTRYADIELDQVDVVYGFDAGSGPAALVLGSDRRSGGLVTFAIDAQSGEVRPLSARPLVAQSEVTGLCGYRSPETGKHYAFASTDDGEVQQWEFFAKGGKVDGRLVRALPVGVGAGYCVVDDAPGALYVSEEKVGIWKFDAEPETDAERTLVDGVGARGNLIEEVKGLAIHRSAKGPAYLVAADIKAERFNVYSLEDSKYLGSVRIGAGAGIDAVGESEGLDVVSLPLATGFPGGLLVVMDEDNDGAAGNLKLVAWKAIADALRLTAGTPVDPRVAPEAPKVVPVEPVAETDPVDNYGDAADDPAIWVHPTNPAKSLIIAAQKKRGIYVYGLDGKTRQVLPDGRMNNVDVRGGFRLGAASVGIVAATNRTDKTLALYGIDAATGRLSSVAEGRIPTGLGDPYGLCMYRSAKSGEHYVFANGSGDGAFKQWKLVARGGKVGVELVREFTVGTQSEGCVADDETGALYVTEEDVGLWRYSAEPDGGATRTQLDSTEKGNLEADAEGVSIYAGPNGTGYVVVSNQGADNYALYRRDGENEFIGYFAIVANDELGVDGASETDGLDVTSAPLGSAFPRGLLVVQDGRNITPRERQNFKLVPWERIAAAMGLEARSE
jgi:3-phytase